MQLWRNIISSRSARNAAASYFSFISVGLWGFVSIPVAVRYLDKEQLGLWAVVNAILTYLLWMDLGIGNSTGRLMAQAVEDKDRDEINKWWSAIRFVLFLQAGLILLVGLPLCPLVVTLLVPGQTHYSAALELLAGGVLISAVFFPIRGIPGLLTAQQRFHWVPLIGGIAPWFNLLLFYLFLDAGWGLRAYLVALAGSQLFTRLLYTVALRRGKDRPRWDRTGITKVRFKALFGYSSKITIIGLIEAVLKTLPVMIISRAGGPAMVPVYNFASKAPLMGYSLASRSYQSFYPSLLGHHLRGDRGLFETRFEVLGRLTLGIGLIGGGLLLALNKSIVLLLAGEEFYPGDWTNIWFSCSPITFPLSGLLMMLIYVSGVLGQMPAIYFMKIAIAFAGGYIGWKTFGFSGVAACFTLMPMVGGAYGYFHGARECGTGSMHRTCGGIVVLAAFCMALIIACGWMALGMPGSPLSFWAGRLQIVLPSPAALGMSLIPVAFGAFIAVTSFLQLAGKNTQKANPPS